LKVEHTESPKKLENIPRERGKLYKEIVKSLHGKRGDFEREMRTFCSGNGKIGNWENFAWDMSTFWLRTEFFSREIGNLKGIVSRGFLTLVFSSNNLVQLDMH
jgi:hypothetical protein